MWMELKRYLLNKASITATMQILLLHSRGRRLSSSNTTLAETTRTTLETNSKMYDTCGTLK